MFRLNVNYEKRVYGLDIFRAIAILLVVLGHGNINVAGDLFQSIPHIPLIDGVELFFVLSGFLIGGILIKIIEKQKTFSWKILNSFWKRRWFRTLPNYFLILLLNYLFVKFNFINGDLSAFGWKFFLFVHNFHEGFQGFFWESWSLSIEEWFYIVLPLVFLVSLKFLPKKRAILFGILLLILLPLIYRISIADVSINAYWWDVGIRKVVITRLDAIIYGVLGAYIKFYHPNIWQKNRLVLFLVGIMIIYANILAPRDYDHFYFKTFYFSIMSFGVLLLLPFADGIKKFKIPWFGKMITHISLISYSMYLINLGLVAQVIQTNVVMDSKLEQGLWYIVYWVITIFVSTLLYKYFEKPMMDLRDRL